MRPIARAILCALLLGAGLLVAGNPSSATNAPGTVVVGDTGTSTQPFVVNELGVSPSGIAYEQSAPGGADQSWFGLPAGSSTPVPLTALPTGDGGAAPLISGSLAVVFTDLYPSGSSPTLSWERLDGTSSATNVPIVPSGKGFVASSEDPGVGAAPDGWVTIGSPVAAPDDNDVLLVTTGGDVTNLGAAPGLFVGSLTGGPNGVVTSAFNENGNEVTYIPYAAPHTPVTLSGDVEQCTEVLSADAICETQIGTVPGSALVPLNGSPLRFIPNDDNNVVGTTSVAVWTDANGSLSYEPWSRGTVTTLSSGVDLPVTSRGTALVADNSEIVFSGGTGLGASGIASLVPPSTTPDNVVTATAAPIEATGLAIGPGRAAWTDDAPASGVGAAAQPLWSRSLSNSAGTLSQGSANLLGGVQPTSSLDALLVGPGYGVSEPTIGVSGQRTLASSVAGDLQLFDGTSSSPTTIAAPVDSTDPVGALSGARVAYESGAYPGTTNLFDSVTATSSPLSAIPGGSPFALWGDYVAWLQTNGSIWRMDLSAAVPTPVQVLAAPDGGSDTCFTEGQDIFVSGDYVAWAEDCENETNGTDATLLGYRNMTTMSPAVDLTSIGIPVALSNSYVAVTLPPPPESCLCGGGVIEFGDAFGSGALSAVNLTTSATTNVGEASFGSEFEGFPPTVALDGSTISWIDENGVPEAAPLPSQPNPPRFLGDPSTPASYNPSSGDWNAELDTSAALTGCSVAISSDSTPVATLPCKATDMALGDADVSWNGTATGGATVPNGSYTWTLSASNADGGVESPSGGALTLSGQVAVTSPAPYSPLTPVRICDTRKGNPSNLNGPAAQCNGNFNSGSTITPGGTRVINVATGADEIAAPADATAVVLNVTVVNPATAGHLTVYPSGAPQPLASNINFAAGQTVPNLVDVGVGTSGDVTLSSSARTDVVVDVEGYTSPTASGGSGAGLYNPLASPARICDTRAGNPSDLSSAPDNQCNNGSSGKRLSVSGTLPVQVSGDNGIPAGATAAVLNVTAANPAAQGFLTVYPTGSSRPTASNVNYSAGRASANRVVVPLSGGGGITVYSSQSSDVVVDVSGYYSDAGGSGSLSSAGSTPMRICDTRTASPLNQCTGHTITQGGILTVNAAGLAGVPATGATAVVVNLTGVDPSQQTFLTVFPQAPRPDVSDLNPAPMTVRANLVVATLSPTGTISIYNNTGSINVVVDVLGWYS